MLKEKNNYAIVIRTFASMLLLFSILFSHQASALILNKVGGTFNAANKLISWTTEVETAPGALLKTKAITLQYHATGGAAIGVALADTTNAKGIVSAPAPAPAIPAAAAALGNSVTITDPDLAPAAKGSRDLKWYNAAWLWGITPKITWDPIGRPGEATQLWTLVDTDDHSSPPPSLVTINDDEFGTRNLSIIDSAFYLRYTQTDVIGDEFMVDIDETGGNSFIRLSDGTYVSFADRSSLNIHFGTISGVAGVAAPSFDFLTVGTSGTWSYDSMTDLTTGEPTSFSSFNANAISVTSVPVPASVWLFTSGLLGLMRFTRKRNS